MFRTLLFLIIVLLPTLASLVEAKELQVWAVDRNFMLIDEVYEGEEFGVYVTDADDPRHYPLANLTIEFNGEEFYVSEDNPSTFPICYLQAPEVAENKIMKIVAKKEGYEDGIREIMIINKKKLLINLLSSVKSGEKLNVLVEDESGEAVPGVNVKLIMDGKEVYSTYTNKYGLASLSIPEVEENKKFLIVASKANYKSAKVEGEIKCSSSAFHLPSYILPVLGIIGIAIFIFAGVIKYVRREGEFSEKEEHEVRKIPDFTQRGDIKIEEIVVRKPEKHVNSKPIKSHRPCKIGKTGMGPEEWILGEDSIIAKIDEKIGGKAKVDTSQWLTGKEDIIEKIDRKLKAYDKRRKQDIT